MRAAKNAGDGRKYFAFGLKGKAILGLGGLLLLALVATGGMAYWQSLQLAEKVAMQRALGEIAILGSQIEAAVRESRHALMVIRDTPPVQAIIRSRDGGGTDPLSGDKLTLWEQRLQTIFVSFMTQLPQIHQLHYLDDKGNELVRVDAANGQVLAMQTAGLQNKAERGYFKETMKIANGEVYFSNMDLNREQGQIQQPHTPVLRMATPVFDGSGNRRGMLVINLLGKQLFAGLDNGKYGIHHYVINKDGYFLHHPDMTKAFGFDLGFDFTVRDEFPLLAELVPFEKKHVAYYAQAGKVEAFHKLRFDHRSFTLIAVIPDDVVFAGVRAGFNPLLLSILVIILISLLLITWLVSHYIVAPVVQLATAAGKMVDGDLSTRLPEHAVRDEFKLLYQTLNAFAENQQHATGQLEHEVAVKTTHLSSIVNSLVDGLITIDKHGLMQSFNPAAVRIFGYAPDEVIGRNVKMLMPEPYHSEHDGYLQHFHDTGEKKIIGIGREVEGRRKDGSIFPMDLAVTEVSLDGSSGFVGIVRDITERKLAEEQLQKLLEKQCAILDNAAYAIISTQPDGIITSFNPAAERMLGYTAVEMVGLQTPAIIHEPSEVVARAQELSVELGEEIAPGFEVFVAKSRQNMPNEYEWTYIRKDGTRFPVILSATALRNAAGVIIGFLGMAMDISERKQSEAALKQAKKTAEKANAAKSEFLSSMSHELRTPMNAILGFAQLLEDNPEEPLSEEQAECVRHILKSGNHLLQLINEVLDMARIEAGRVTMSIEAVHPRILFDSCLEMIGSMADKRGIRIHDLTSGRDLPAVRADYTRFKQVLLNLLSNAVKYNSKDGEIWLECQAGEADMLRISVRDSGPGIADEKMQQVFVPFNRLGAEGSAVEGTGIGLTIAKQLVELMDGHIGYDSVIGMGCTFWLELPLDGEDPHHQASLDSINTLAVECTPAVERAVKTLLYVEDNPANMSLMKHIIGRISHLELITAHNAELGLELAESKQPDLIIMDINLPGMDGFEALRNLQQNDLTKDIPVVALSANAMDKDIKRGIAAGFTRYLTKPIRVNEVHEVIDEILGTRA